jgi:hypothetical protein
VRSEGAVCSRVAQNEIADRVRHRLEITLRNPVRKRNAQRIAIAARVLDGDETFLPCDTDLDDPSRFQKLGDERRQHRCRLTQLRSLLNLAHGQVSHSQKQVVDRVRCRPRLSAFSEMLELQLDLFQRGRIEELAQLGLAEELAELGLVDGQGLGASLGERRVAVV